MLFWSFIVTTLVYAVFGLACVLCLRLKKKAVVFGVPVLYLAFGELRVLLSDAVVCTCLISNSWFR